MNITLYIPCFHSGNVEFWEYRSLKVPKINRLTKKGNLVVSTFFHGELIFSKVHEMSGGSNGNKWSRHRCLNKVIKGGENRRPYIQITVDT